MPELLSPAGNFEKLRAAILYGADAVYLAGHEFGMRAAADNFSVEEIYDAVKYAHERGVKVYVTVNTMPRTAEYKRLEEYLESIKDSGVDALIIADIGVMSLAKRVMPHTEIHVSTQSSIVSAATCVEYQKLGATRIVLARELSFKEIKDIRDNIPKELEIEAFIHGSMCVSYSGRCLLSEHFIGRDANMGKCAQPCRWNYSISGYEIYEEKRPGVKLPIEQTIDGTFIMGSMDMCMIEHIGDLMESGIDSFKIEGRMKSAYYTAVTTNAYRMAIDRYNTAPASYEFDEALKRELESVSHREYCTGYYYDTPTERAQLCSENGYIREKAYLAIAKGYDEETGEGIFVQRNKLCDGDTVEIITPGKTGTPFKVEGIKDENRNPLESTPHPFMEFRIKTPFKVKEGDILRA